MSCAVVQILAFGPVNVFSDSTSGTSFVVSGELSTAEIKQVRTSLEVLAITTNGSVQLGYQLSNDKQSWYSDAATPVLDAVTLLGSAVTSVTASYGTTFDTVPAHVNGAKLFLRFVVLCKTTASGLVLAHMVGRLETKALA